MRVRPTGASDRSPRRPGAHGTQRPDIHRGAAAGGGQAAARWPALARSAIAPYARRILDRPRLKFLSWVCIVVSVVIALPVMMSSATVRDAELGRVLLYGGLLIGQVGVFVSVLWGLYRAVERGDTTW